MRLLILKQLGQLYFNKSIIPPTSPLAKKLIRSVTNRLQSTCPREYALNTDLFRKVVLTEDLKKLQKLFTKYEFELRIAGGAVRDLLMDIEPHDVDLATDALPEQMLDVFRKERIKIFNLNGIKHGTVTVRINERSSFEITTLRIDVKCYGRQAEVEFTSDWHADAIRRDLTFNALFLDFDGKIYDYVNGYEDLKNKIVRFVGVADKRVKEDYLRILRYFRFVAKVCDDPHRLDAASIKAIKDNVEGLEGISAERKSMELRKILSLKFSDTFMRMFYDMRIDKYTGLPRNGNVENYARIYESCFAKEPSQMTLLFALMNNKNDVLEAVTNLKLTKAEAYLLYALDKYVPIVNSMESEEEILVFLNKEFVRGRSNVDRSLKKVEAFEIVKYCKRSNLIEKIREMIFPRFELNANSKELHGLMILDPFRNEKLGFVDLVNARKLRANRMVSDLREKWIDSDFSMSRQELVNSLDEATLSSYVNLTKKEKNKI